MKKDETAESLSQAPLGKKSSYINTYTPSLLFPIPRQLKRDEIGISEGLLPFTGFDIWNAFELSWLNSKGKPVVAFAEFYFPCESRNIIESKSFKLYLNSFNNSRFFSLAVVKEILEIDLSRSAHAPVKVNLYPLNEAPHRIGTFQGTCLDELDIECSKYMPDPSYLSAGDTVVQEVLHTHLLKSNCLVTGQPDWGSLEVVYEGGKIHPEGLLKYIVSLRDHNEFHEQCVERIFNDILKSCRPKHLSVYARYTRRGGLDINPYRTTTSRAQDLSEVKNDRLIRQ